MTDRERFEAWISAPPYERSTELYWNGEYFSLAVQLAWEAWQEAQRELRKALEASNKMIHRTVTDARPPIGELIDQYDANHAALEQTSNHKQESKRP